TKTPYGKPDPNVWLPNNSTSRISIYPTVKTACLYHVPFKRYKHFRELPFFKKWTIVVLWSI
ncbi:unnamed protein product, partial [Adineta steineri]